MTRYLDPCDGLCSLAEDGFLRGKRYLIQDRDPLFIFEQWLN